MFVGILCNAFLWVFIELMVPFFEILCMRAVLMLLHAVLPRRREGLLNSGFHYFYCNFVSVLHLELLQY
jgi:hypothetical protein